MKLTCYTCNVELNIDTMRGIKGKGVVYSEWRDYWTSTTPKQQRAEDDVAEQRAVFFCPDCFDAHHINDKCRLLSRIARPWSYDVSGSDLVVTMEVLRGYGSREFPITIKPDMTIDHILAKAVNLSRVNDQGFIATVPPEFTLTLEDVQRIFPPKWYKAFKKSLNGRLRRGRKQWRERDKVLEHKGEIKKKQYQGLANEYAAMDSAVYDDVVEISKLIVDITQKVDGSPMWGALEFIQAICKRQRLRDPKTHDIVLELAQITHVMKA
jgi:hypothetical protein